MNADWPTVRATADRSPRARPARRNRSGTRPLPHEGVYARIGPSRIHGVGVLAIRDIPAGTRLFRGEDERVVWVSCVVVRRLPAPLRQLYWDFGMLWGDSLGVPRTLNMLSVGWYLNHSACPNVEADGNGRFHTLRRVKKGEELTADYRTFADAPLPFEPVTGLRRDSGRPVRRSPRRRSSSRASQTRGSGG